MNNYYFPAPLRDVGKTVNRICGQDIMNEGLLYRGGTVNKLADESELPDVQTILNLKSTLLKN
ncbi:MAG: hypothetical protein D3904_01760 [Candidatus Electrothrix sp. EH2]|nr:hypothetical protein [Candidatus Electrothrix sp. EH2]